MHSPCDARNIQKCLPLFSAQGIQKRGVNLPPRFADHASSCLPTSAPVLFQCTLPSRRSHLHSLAQSTYVATFLPKHVITTRFADSVTSTSGAIRLAFDLLPWPQVIYFPGLSLVVSALFRWPYSISIHLSPRSVTAGVRPFPLAMQHFWSFVSQV